jgi:glutathione S-transferase
MAMTLYGGKLSPFVARAILAARYKGMKFTLTTPADGTKTPAYLKIHPFGKVPALKDGATVVFESSVIVEYLDAKGKGKKLVPKAAKAAVKVRQIGAVAAEYVQSAVNKFFPFLQGSGDANALNAAQAELDRTLDVLEKAVVKGKYAGGAQFSIADVNVVPALCFASLITGKLGLGDPLNGRPKLKRYFAAMKKDKTAGAVIADMSAEWNRMMGG